MNCGGQGAAESRLATPHNLKNLIVSYDRFALSDYLRVSPLVVCVNAGWIHVDPPCIAGPGTCDRYGNLRVALVASSDNQTSLARHYIDGPRRLYSEENIWNIVAPEWATYWKRSFELNFQGRTPTPLTPEAAKQLETVSSDTATRLAELQRAHAARVRGGLGQGQLGTSAVELAGAKKLLESFVTLGFPQAVGNDDFLRSLLFSNEAIIDDQQIAISYAPPPPALSATAAISEAQLRVNPRIELRELGTKRSEVLSGLLNDYLGSISTAIYREDNALIAGARFDMLMARAIADPNAPLPRGSWVIFLPQVVR